jgi:hypothetical protein
MRKHTIEVSKTINFTDILKFGRELLNKTGQPAEVLALVNNEYLKKIGIKYILEYEHNTKQIPDIIYQTDEESKEPKNGLSFSDGAIIQPAIQPAEWPAKLYTTRRIIFVCNRASRNHQIQAASEANGIVIDYYTWKVLSYPPAALSFNMSEDTIIKHLESKTYKIYNIDFGTIITLYYYNGKWVISSANGYEIDNKIWIGTRTFRNLVDEIFEKYDIDVSKLNIHWCYTFGFHHNEYHPFDGAGQPPIRAWFIRAVNIVEYNTSFNIVSADNTIVDGKIPMQTENIELNKLAVSNPKGVMANIKDICSKSYVNYINDRRVTPVYGFVLLSANPSLIADVLIESDLQKKLRKFICRRPPNELDPTKRFNWMMINSSIDKIDDKPIFRKMFPQTIAVGEKFDKLLIDLAKKIVLDFNKENVVYGNNQFDQLVKFVIDQMKKQSHNINKKPESIGIVQDFLRRDEFVYLYAEIL